MAPATVELRIGRGAAAVLVLLAAFALVLALGPWLAGRAADSGAGAETDGVENPLPRSLRFWSAPVAADGAPTPAAHAGPARPEGSIDTWPHEALAALRDPNLFQPGYAPLRAEEVAGDLALTEGPRLAVSGLNEALTYDFGTVAVTLPTRARLELRNLGAAPLRIARAYPSTGALQPRVGGSPAMESGWLAAPLEIPPGEAAPLELELDPARLTAAGTQALYLQLYSNDPAHEPYDEGDPQSREARLRLVLDARPLADLRRPIAPEEVPLRAGAPRLAIPELARDGRGGDAISLGELPAGERHERTIELRNAGDVPLEVALSTVNGAWALEPPTLTIEPGASAAALLRITDLAARSGPHFQHLLRLETNDPLAPLVELRAVGTWIGAAGPGGMGGPEGPPEAEDESED